MVNLTDGPSIPNAFHVRDYEYSIQVNRWFLRPIGAWPKLTKTSRTQKLLSRMLNVACHTVIIFTIAPCVLYILCEDESAKARMKAVGPMSHWLMGELNYCCLLMRSSDIARCVEHVEHDWQIVHSANDRELMLKNAKIGRFIAYVAALCMHSGVLLYNMITGFKKIEFHVGNDSYSMYLLPCPVYTNLLDVRFSPVNEIVFALQFLSGIIVTSVTVGACGLAAVLAMHACGQLNVVMARLDELVDRREEEKREGRQVAQRKLGFIVEHHLRTLRYSVCYSPAVCFC